MSARRPEEWGAVPSPPDDPAGVWLARVTRGLLRVLGDADDEVQSRAAGATLVQDGGGRLRVVPTDPMGFEVAIEVSARRVVVTIDALRHVADLRGTARGGAARSPVATEEEEDAAEADRADEDAVALALDLVAAALFGELRVVLSQWGRGGRWRLGSRVQLARGPVWVTLAYRGVAALPGRLGTVEVVRRNSLPRPPGCEAVRWKVHAGLPLFAGAGGFLRPYDPREGEARAMAIDGVLDLHGVLPRELPRLVAAYLDECSAHGILDVRLIHGKGKGVARDAVHRVLAARTDVERAWQSADRGAGSWGATLVRLRPTPPESPPESPSDAG